MLKNICATFVRGFSMGTADIVPGVSGGTVALVFGIYEQLLSNVRLGAKALGSLVTLDFQGFVSRMKSVEWGFLLPLAAGLGVAVIALTSLLEGLLQEYPEEMAGLFFGLVVASVVVAWGLLHSIGVVESTVMVATGAASFFLLGFQSGPTVNPPGWAFLIAGSLAICAMILPGISGSFILLMMGMYSAVLGAVHDKDLLSIGLLLVGAVCGLAVFSTLLGYLLDNFHDIVVAVLIGLMIGSLRVLWPWPHGVGIISEDESEVISGTGIELPAAGEVFAPTALAAVAFIVVLGVSKLADRLATPSASTSV